jgi:methylenetetrahydrofolate reductase (NADPH)
VAGYPEKHYEAPNFDKDLQYLKQKVDQGAHYIITQMFFDFRVYKNFVERGRSIGIKVPILPGIKPIISLNQLSSLPRDFHISIPSKLVESMENAKSSTENWNKLCERPLPAAYRLWCSGNPYLHYGKRDGNSGITNLPV